MWKTVVAPTVLVSVVWVLVSCGTWYALGAIDDNETLLLSKNRSVIESSEDMQQSLWRLEAVLFAAAERKGQQGQLSDKLAVETQLLERDFNRALAGARQNASTSEEQALLQIIDERFARYRTVSSEWLTRSGLSPEESAASLHGTLAVGRDVAQSCEELADLGQRLMNATFQQRDRLRTKLNMMRIAFIVVGPAVGILLGLHMARRLNYSISEISVTLRDASGNLEQEVGLVEVSPAGGEGGLPALQQQVQYVSGRIKQVVDELQRTRQQAVRSERLAMVGELAAGVAHEVRNPLTSVKLLIQATERSPSLSAADKQRLQIVQQEIARIETTVQELLDYARPPKLRRVRHDVRDTLRRALNLAVVRAEQSRIAIEEQLGSGPLIVDADPEQLQQVFINLMLNAIEAMSPGGTLHVTIEEPDAPVDSQLPLPSQAVLRIVFRDTGSGIRDDVLQRLFEPFVTSKERGIGLGLAISRQIMQEHNGRLSASNAVPCGASFVVELPLAEEAPPERLAGVAADTSAAAADWNSTGDAPHARRER